MEVVVASVVVVGANILQLQSNWLVGVLTEQAYFDKKSTSACYLKTCDINYSVTIALKVKPTCKAGLWKTLANTISEILGKDTYFAKSY